MCLYSAVPLWAKYHANNPAIRSVIRAATDFISSPLFVHPDRTPWTNGQQRYTTNARHEGGVFPERSLGQQYVHQEVHDLDDGQRQDGAPEIHADPPIGT
jgi:hypothetical protein